MRNGRRLGGGSTSARVRSLSAWGGSPARRDRTSCSRRGRRSPPGWPARGSCSWGAVPRRITFAASRARRSTSLGRETTSATGTPRPTWSSRRLAGKGCRWSSSRPWRAHGASSRRRFPVRARLWGRRLERSFRSRTLVRWPRRSSSGCSTRASRRRREGRAPARSSSLHDLRATTGAVADLYEELLAGRSQ